MSLSDESRSKVHARKSLRQNRISRVLANSTLLTLIKNKNLVEPFTPQLMSCNGIDLRLADEYYSLQPVKKIFDTHKRNLLGSYYHKHKNQNVLVRPNSKLLVSSVEQLKMPDNMIALAGLRSSYARLGLQMPSGFVDPGFVGKLTFEISGGSFPVLLHAGDRVFHAVLAMLDRPSKVVYQGKYQHQRSVTLPIFP